jgi:hypothetical protein
MEVLFYLGDFRKPLIVLGIDLENRRTSGKKLGSP